MTTRVTGVDGYGAVVDTETVLPTSADLGVFSGAVYAAGTAYDEWGRVESSTQPAFAGLPAETVVTDYDDYGRPASLTAGSADLVSAVTYLPTGQLDTRTLGNQMVRDVGWDINQGRIDSVTAFVPANGSLAGATVQADTYSYDTAGRMISRPDPDGTGSQSLQWDVLSTLTSAGGETYLYDGDGQRVARMMDGAVTVWVGVARQT